MAMRKSFSRATRAISVLCPGLNPEYEASRLLADVMLLEFGGYYFLNYFAQEWRVRDREVAEDLFKVKCWLLED